MCLGPKRSKRVLIGLKLVLHLRGPHGVWCRLSIGQHRGEVITSILRALLGTRVGRTIQGTAETLMFGRG